MKPTQDAQNTPAPGIASISMEDMKKSTVEEWNQLRAELKEYHSRCFHLTDALNELLFLINGIELIDHYVDDNCLLMPDDGEDLNACAALKEAAMDQIKSQIGAMITIASGEPCCVEL